MCDRATFKDYFKLKYCLGRYKIRKLYDDAIDDCLSALKIVLDLFVADKKIRKLQEALSTRDDILVFMKILVTPNFLVLMKWVFLV